MVKITPDITIGPGNPLVIIGGPCVIESETLCLEIGTELKRICDKLGLQFVFKASYDKANRTSISSFRGPGLAEGLAILKRVRDTLGVPVTTDIHGADEARPVADVAAILQIPAFLCRQTDLLVAAANTGRVVNIKKGQFLAPADMRPAVNKVTAVGNEKIVLTERGTTFGYNNLVVDMRSLMIMRELEVPVIFDATHSVQLPGGQGDATGGQRQYAPGLMRAAAAVGIDGIFIEAHPAPDQAKSDGANALALDSVESVLTVARDIHQLVNNNPV